MPMRMWKFLRRHYSGSDSLANNLRAHEEFGIDIFEYGPGAPKPCFSPMGEAWRDDVAVEIEHTLCDGMNYWERTIHTPAGDLHDIKRTLIVTEGSGGGPEIVEPLVKDLGRDIERYRYMHADPAMIDVAGGKRMADRIGERGIVVGDMYSPIDCRDAMRQEDFLMLYHDDREAFREIVGIAADAMMAETQVVLDAGFEVVKTWWFYASPSAGWSPRIYEEVFLPHLVAHVEQVHSQGGVYIYYDDGRMQQFLDFYVQSGADCIMTCTPPPLGDVDPAALKQTYGDRVCLMGGIDAVNEIYLSSPERIREMVQERLRILMPGGRYIMDGSNSLVYETPAENVRAVTEAGLEVGVYP